MKLVYILLLCLTHQLLLCQAYLQLDQDIFGIGNEDRNYTQGTEFGGFINQNHVLDDLNFIGNLIKKSNCNISSHALFGIGGVAFTPDSIGAVDIIKNDRPYSSLIYFKQSNYIYFNDKASIRNTTTIGMLGLRVMEKVQTGIHRGYRNIFGGEAPVDARGWGNQISDGGEITLNFGSRFRFSEPVDDESNLVLRGELGFDFGTLYKAIGTGLSLHTGTQTIYTLFGIDPNFINSVPRFRNDSEVSPELKRFRYALFGGINVDRVFHNQLLSGSRKSEEEYYTVDEEKFVWHGFIGVTFGFTVSERYYDIRYVHNWRSQEFEISEDGRWHKWGTIVLITYLDK